MPDIEALETGYSLNKVRVGEPWSSKDPSWLRRKFTRLGRLAAEAPGLAYREISGLSKNLPPFLLTSRRRLGLLAMPQGVVEKALKDFPADSIRPAVVVRRGDATIAGLLPDDIVPGHAELAIDQIDGWRRVRAWPAQSVDDLESGSRDAAGFRVRIRTLLYQFGHGGQASAALGLLVGGESLVLPDAVVNRPAVDGVAPSGEVLAWARASNTPIL